MIKLYIHNSRPGFRDVIKIFVDLCEGCQLKKGRPKKGLVVKPIISEDRNSRCQIDLIDLQSCPADEYKFILVYQVWIFNILDRKK